MAHAILGNRFYNRDDKPAWHGIGVNDLTARTAVEAVEEIGGTFDVVKRPLYLTLPDEPKKKVESGLFALMREPIPEDPQWRRLGSAVGADYELITPRRALELWFDNVRDDGGNPAMIETLAFLNEGERMFITTKLPSYEVKGDEVASYLLYDNPLESNNSLGVYTTGVRVVCQNTLSMGINDAVERRVISHTKGAIEYLEKWLSTIYASAVRMTKVMETSLNVLAEKRLTDVQVKWIVDTLYPMPKKPTTSDMSKKDIVDRIEHWEKKVERQKKVRAICLDLYNGMGGRQTPAVEGTAFGAYNAVSELEDNRIGDLKGRVGSLIDGKRGKRIRNAYVLAMNADRYDDPSKIDLRELYKQGLTRLFA